MGSREDFERLALSLAFWFFVLVCVYIIWTRLGYVTGAHMVLAHSVWAAKASAQLAWYPFSSEISADIPAQPLAIASDLDDSSNMAHGRIVGEHGFIPTDGGHTTRLGGPSSEGISGAGSGAHGASAEMEGVTPRVADVGTRHMNHATVSAPASYTSERRGKEAEAEAGHGHGDGDGDGKEAGFWEPAAPMTGEGVSQYG